MTGEKSKERHYDEEGYTWSKKELMHKRPSNSKKRTIAESFLLVEEGMNFIEATSSNTGIALVFNGRLYWSSNNIGNA